MSWAAKLARSTIFASGTCTGIYASCAFWNTCNTRQQANQNTFFASGSSDFNSWTSFSRWLHSQELFTLFGSPVTAASISENERRRRTWLKRVEEWESSVASELPSVLSSAISATCDFGRMGIESWFDADKNQRTTWLIIGANLVVFGLFRAMPNSLLMEKYFVNHSINSSFYRPISMLTSVMSHRTVLHLAFNMIGLNSILPLVMSQLGHERGTAFYLSTGVLGNLVAGAVRLQYGFSSIGASGALFGMVAYLTTTPIASQIRLHPIFLPASMSVTLSEGWMFMTGIDMGMVLLSGGRWFWDHAGHVAGSIAGLILKRVQMDDERDLEGWVWARSLWIAHQLFQFIDPDEK